MSNELPEDASEFLRSAPEIQAIHNDTRNRTVTDYAALARFELFLFTAIATVLIVRGFLAATGYPRIGGGGLHIAHVLWGGLLLGVSVVLATTGVGSRVHSRSAFIGGIGFGLFIDEVGKFLTKNVNYFYEPAVAIIYLVFIVSFLVGREVILRHRLTERHRLALASGAVADLVLGQLDERQRLTALRRLEPVDGEFADIAPSLRGPLELHRGRQTKVLHRLRNARNTVFAAGRQIATNPIAQGVAVVLILYKCWERVHKHWDILDVIHRDHEKEFYLTLVVYTNFVTVAAVLVALALLIFPGWRHTGLYLLQISLLVDLLFNQFATFDYSQFRALRDFSVELLMFLGVSYLLRVHPADGKRHAATRR